MLTLEPERLKNRSTTTREHAGDERTVSLGALRQLATSVSQRRSFLPSSTVIAAILRASVSRTMVGLMPLASDRW
jgi:hypothetical protein